MSRAPVLDEVTESDASARAPSIRPILGVRVAASSYDDASRRILAWSRGRVGRYVCVANVHMTMEAVDDEGFRSLVNGADLVVPDGMPLVWALRRLGVPEASRVYGPTLTLHLCRAAAAAGVPIGLYGGHPDGLAVLRANLEAWFPGLRVAYAEAPPFRPLSEAEDAATVEAIRASGARVLLVGLGCPKQERWMLAHRDRLPLVQVGVGAAFAFHAGLVRQAPRWMGNAGLEWAFRLAMEPRRLARRYLRQNPRFVLRLARQLWAQRRVVQEAHAHD